MSHAVVVVAPDGSRVKKVGIEKAVAWEMKPFDENGACFRDGSRWDWYVIGGRWDGYFLGNNIIQVKTIDLDALRRQSEKDLRVSWQESQKRENVSVAKFIYDVDEGEMEDAYVARKLGSGFPAAYAFLRSRHWHERERMGWFGAPAYTECERKDMDKPVADPNKWFGKCLHKDKKTGARVVCWNEPSEIWTEQFYKRFIEPLPSETHLVAVDYHV